MAGRIMFLIGALFVLISMFLPWVEIPGILTYTGIETDGMFAGLVGVVCLVIGLIYKGKPGKRYFPAGIVLALLPAFLIFSMVSKFIKVQVIDGQFINPLQFLQVGYVITLIGLLLIFIGSLIVVSKEDK